jgi:hypothetical protein
MMAINAQAIHSLQQDIKDFKRIRSEILAGELPHFHVKDYNEAIRCAKHRMSLLERNQRAMAQEMQELIFQGHMDKLGNFGFDDMIYH